MNIEKINNSQRDMNYASVSFVIQWINSTGHLDIVDMGWSKNLILSVWRSERAMKRISRHWRM